MIFLGNTFFSGENSLYHPAVNWAGITAVQLFDGTYNHLILSSNSSMTVNDITDEWDYDTKINANFDGKFDAGNTGFSLRNTDHVVIKRRELGSTQWVVIYVKEINKISDFDISFTDKYARSGVEYQYSVSSYTNGIENSFIIDNVYSEFDGYYITDKDCLYGTIYDVDGCDTSRNMANQVLQLLNSKYVSVVSNSEVSYESGSITGSFIQIDETSEEIKLQEGLHYRTQLKDRLVNKKPLILKISDGRIWMIQITGAPTDSQNGHRDLRTITFEWVEIGDINDMKALYESGLSDVDARWWF